MIPISMIDADLSNVRQEKIEEVKASLEEIGTLLHSITVRPDNGRYRLAAGKARLAAYIALGRTEIPAQIDESDRSDREISLHENLKRSNLEWWELVELEVELHELRISQYGKRRTGRNASKTEGWSQQDTAKELGIALGSLSQDLTLANAVRRNPHLAKIKDKMTALKLVKEAAKREHIEAETLIPDLFEMNQVFFGNSLDILKELPGELFDSCITDPPWIEFKDDRFVSDESTLPVFKEIYRVLKRDTLLYAIVSTPDWYLYHKELPGFGFAVQDYPLIWHKTGTISHGRRNWEYARDYEPILLAAKGAPVLSQGTQMSAVLKFQAVHSTKLVHPNEKPIELMKEIIKQSTFDGARILDPFAGSGATLIAAKQMNRKYIGIERQHEFYVKIQERLDAEDNNRVNSA